MKFRIISLFTAAVLMQSALISCTDSKNSDAPAKSGQSGAEEIITLPEGEDKTEEIIINENYSDSELYTFDGTVDEIYEDGSILVYSPEFRVDFNYMVIVEFDENTVTDNFELAENQHIKFEVYSEVKKSEPLTVVAAKLTLLNQVSTQREEEAARIAALEKQVQDVLSGENDTGTQGHSSAASENTAG